MKRSYSIEDTEPTESQFKLPKEIEHLFQVTDVNPLVEPNGENPDIQIVKLEIVGGDDNGISILNRVNINQEEKSFYFSRLFLKAIGESYKGQFDIETDRWCGRQFYATIKHTKSKDGTKTYANIDQYNFSKKIEQPYQAPNPGGVVKPEDIAW
jgi:hypothetical protein